MVLFVCLSVGMLIRKTKPLNLNDMKLGTIVVLAICLSLLVLDSKVQGHRVIISNSLHMIGADAATKFKLCT